MNFTLSTLLFGLLLGIKHAFEVDHMVAVSTLVTQHKSPLKASLIGAFWGAGHTTTLFIVGLFVLVLKLNIPEKVSLSLEFIVGLMLIGLGLRIFFRQKNIHLHAHSHEGTSHAHLHEENHHVKHHASFVVGLVHGLAGSGALMVLVLSTIHSTLVGIYYILLFGIGSMIGMACMSFIIGLPILYTSKKFPHIDMHLRKVAGILSIIFGLFIIYEIGYVEGLLSLSF